MFRQDRCSFSAMVRSCTTCPCGSGGVTSINIRLLPSISSPPSSRLYTCCFLEKGSGSTFSPCCLAGITAESYMMVAAHSNNLFRAACSMLSSSAAPSFANIWRNLSSEVRGMPITFFVGVSEPSAVCFFWSKHRSCKVSEPGLSIGSVIVFERE